MARQGRIAPDLWMRGATGAPVGPEALLAATERALAAALLAELAALFECSEISRTIAAIWCMVVAI